MSVLIAAGATSASLTLAAGEQVTLVLVPSTGGGIPAKAHAHVRWDGAGDYNTDIARLSLHAPATVLAATGTYVVTKGAGTYTVERSD